LGRQRGAGRGQEKDESEIGALCHRCRSFLVACEKGR
jgi:hypothetical protein